MKPTSMQRNKPIAAVIKNYMNKKSGKVAVSRNEIQRRFFGLDWKDQKKIMAAFLESSVSDRQWAYSRLISLWDDAFEEKIRVLWDMYHEDRCGWVIVRHFPIEYLREHVSEFTGERDYYFICLRMAKDKDYVIDRTSLSDIDYLAVLYHTHRTITEDEARNTLYRIIHDCCLENAYILTLEHVGNGRYHNVVTPANYRKVRLAIYYLLKLEKDEIVLQFEQWNETVEDTVYNSPEFKFIDKNDLDNDYEYDCRRIEITNIYAYQALDEKYKLSSDSTVFDMHDALTRNAKWRKMLREQTASAQMRSFDALNVELFDEVRAPF